MFVNKRIKTHRLMIALLFLMGVSFSALLVNANYNQMLYNVLGWVWASFLFGLSFICVNRIKSSERIHNLMLVALILRIINAVFWHFLWTKGIDPGSDQPQFINGSVGLFASRFTGVPYHDEFRQAFTNLLIFYITLQAPMI